MEVRNGGQVAWAATRTANRLRSDGYRVTSIGDQNPQDRPESVVYIGRGGTEEAARQVAQVLGYPFAPLPADLSTDAMVLVILGHDAQV